MMQGSIRYCHQSPPPELRLYVDGYWSLRHMETAPKKVILLPDGKIDLFVARSANDPFHISLLGLTTMPEAVLLAPGMCTFAISFHPLAVEYLLNRPVAGLLNAGRRLPADFWGFTPEDLRDFAAFCRKATRLIEERLPQAPDPRKMRLQACLLETHGNATVHQIEKECYISARQINRYWMKQLGLPLKTYLQLLRFRAAFTHIKQGKLYPEGNYHDQSHFIREVKRLSGHLPKELLNNQNDRFIQFSVLD